MEYVKPLISLEKKQDLERDEWWQAILLFVVWAYSQYAMKDAINKCEKQGGMAKVSNYVFGAVWKVSCYK
ncbi:hypothetical protein L2D08_10650 [Domibacillus sp. PGB-M46]|uniref:hypothetical protein n=1 Tax=Domibacillus sp. PGB-M46 TaxID=2910255 RepID=UPI001F591200|nr:hypothetical protein [Domibacillus sp. PGB-M46]MCI2254823.1 hypothetical protein [Domibacillus sp. PGB-M46]